MKKFQINNKFENGQAMPFVVLILLVIIGMVALIVDGGAIMSNRRTAQAAADAGALAGAQRACLGKNDAKVVAENYAIVNNGATTALATVVGKEVTVNTTVAHSAFFAKIFGVQTLESGAEATAGCYGVKGASVIPLAWACYPNDGTGPFSEEYGCKMQTLSWNLIGPLVNGTVSSVSISDYDGNSNIYYKSGTFIVDSAGHPPEQIYIIFDGDKICSGTICDIDGDGKIDIQVGGDRGYLYLDDINTHNLKDYLDLPSISLQPHTWLSGKAGKDVALINKMVSKSFPGRVVMVPVYNYLCDDDPSTHPACVAGAHASPPWPPFTEADDFSEIRNQSPYYHIIAFAPFYIACVDNQGYCPGYQYAKTKDSTLPKKEPIIEGYFLTDVDVTLDSTDNCSINLGNCTVSLSN